jgi:hypothetical protein
VNELFVKNPTGPPQQQERDHASEDDHSVLREYPRSFDQSHVQQRAQERAKGGCQAADQRV